MENKKTKYRKLKYIKTCNNEQAARIKAQLFKAEASGNYNEFLQTLYDVVCELGGISALSTSTGLSRPTFYRALSINGNPQLTTLLAVLKAIGLRLTIEENYL